MGATNYTLTWTFARIANRDAPLLNRFDAGDAVTFTLSVRSSALARNVNVTIGPLMPILAFMNNTVLVGGTNQAGAINNPSPRYISTMIANIAANSTVNVTFFVTNQGASNLLWTWLCGKNRTFIYFPAASASSSGGSTTLNYVKALTTTLSSQNDGLALTTTVSNCTLQRRTLNEDNVAVQIAGLIQGRAVNARNALGATGSNLISPADQTLGLVPSGIAHTIASRAWANGTASANTLFTTRSAEIQQFILDNKWFNQAMACSTISNIGIRIFQGSYSNAIIDLGDWLANANLMPWLPNTIVVGVKETGGPVSTIESMNGFWVGMAIRFVNNCS